MVKSRAPVRGTQSFVGVMAEVWKRPSLTAIEVLWRWSFGALLFAVWWFTGGAYVWQHRLEYSETLRITLHGGFVLGYDLHGLLRSFVVLLVSCVIWAVFASTGRTLLLRRMDASLHKRRCTMFVLAVLRTCAFWLVIILWVASIAKVALSTGVLPLGSTAEPAYVPGFSVVVFGTLLLFVLWSLVSWILQLAPVLAMVHGSGVWESLRAALKAGPVRGKLIEINLVMGIVKVALVVLAMVFSACPLPFSSAATQTFLTCWWVGVGVWYLLASDYFHVVRAAAYLNLWDAYRLPESERTSAEQIAS